MDYSGAPWRDITELYPGPTVLSYSDNQGAYHPGTDTYVLHITFRVTEAFAQAHPTDPFVSWTVFADQMKAQSGSLSLRDLKFFQA